MIDLLDRERAAAYDCAAYAAEVWERLTGDDVRPHLVGLARPSGYFQRIAAPVEPCLVLMRRGRVAAHVGVFVRGRVQHLGRGAPIRQPLGLASLGYTTVRFYAAR